jgi:Fe-S cluster biosynthesis and repair protein YggX
MADSDARIEQFRKMAADDPDNELGHFSLGRAYMDAGLFDGAVASFQRVIDIRPDMCRVYQLMATCLLRLDKRELAIEQLVRGVKIANERGDLMPRNDMIRMLQELGAPVPELKKAQPDVKLDENQVMCSRCGLPGPRLDRPPFRNKQGELIQNRVCSNCWKEWIMMGTKVINELRLALVDRQARRIFDEHMFEFLNLTDEKI